MPASQIFCLLLPTDGCTAPASAKWALSISLSLCNCAYLTVPLSPYPCLPASQIFFLFIAKRWVYGAGIGPLKSPVSAYLNVHLSLCLCLPASQIFFLFIAKRWVYGAGIGQMGLLMYANFQLLVATHRAFTVIFTQHNRCRAAVDAGYFIIDGMVGGIMLLLLNVLSFIAIVQVGRQLNQNTDTLQPKTHPKKTLKSPKTITKCKKRSIEFPKRAHCPQLPRDRAGEPLACWRGSLAGPWGSMTHKHMP